MRLLCTCNLAMLSLLLVGQASYRLRLISSVSSLSSHYSMQWQVFFCCIQAIITGSPASRSTCEVCMLILLLPMKSAIQHLSAWMPSTKLERQIHKPVMLRPCMFLCLPLPAVVCVVDKLAQAGVQHIVYWSAQQPGPQLVAAYFGHVFAAALQNPSTTVPEVCIPVVRHWSRACDDNMNQTMSRQCGHAVLCCAVLCCAVLCCAVALAGSPISAVLLSLSQQS